MHRSDLGEIVVLLLCGLLACGVRPAGCGEAQDQPGPDKVGEAPVDAQLLADLEILRDLELLRQLDVLRRVEEVRAESRPRIPREEKGKP